MNTASKTWLVDSLASTECPACANMKKVKQSFCLKCYTDLSLRLRGCLYRRIGKGYEEAHRDAMAHLGAEYPKEAAT